MPCFSPARPLACLIELPVGQLQSRLGLLLFRGQVFAGLAARLVIERLETFGSPVHAIVEMFDALAQQVGAVARLTRFVLMLLPLLLPVIEGRLGLFQGRAGLLLLLAGLSQLVIVRRSVRWFR
jgi:hypothetical protein